MRIISFILVLFLACCALETSDKSDEQEKYAPGTIGYVYESCKVCLENEKNADVFQQTYCGRFMSAFLQGFIGAHWIYPPLDGESSPCYEDNKNAYKHVTGNKATEQTPKDVQKKDPTQEFISFFEKWIAYLEHKNTKEDVFTKPVIELWMYTLKKDIEFNKDIEIPAKHKIYINDDLRRDLQNFDYWSEKSTTWGEILDQCTDDVRKAKGSNAVFASTYCGVEILGMVAGVYTIQAAQYGRPAIVKAECKQQIEKYFDELNIEKNEDMCIKDDIDFLKEAVLTLELLKEHREKDEGKYRNFDETEKTSIGASAGLVTMRCMIEKEGN